MSESTIIWKFLSREFPDSHSVIFLHVCGNIQNQQNAMAKVLRLCLPIFTPPMTEQYVKTVIREFLEMKRKQYFNGEIKIKPIYNT